MPYLHTIRTSIVIITAMCMSAIGLDEIPPASEWTEHGIIIPRGSSNDWDGSDGTMVGGLTRKDDTYYCYYVRGFRGNWEANRKGSHTSLGLATSRDGRNWTKHPDNPLLKPHDFLPVHSHEEGVRHAIIHYIPDLDKFIGYFGVEDPGGSQSCSYMQSDCPGDISVDANVYAAESNDGIHWDVKGEVDGVFNGAENYPRAFIYNDGTFYVWTMRNEGGSNHSVSSGRDWLNLSELKFGIYRWDGSHGEQCDAYLHDDKKTVSIIAKSIDDWSKGGFRLGTSSLDDVTKIDWDRDWHPRSTTYQHGKIHKGENEWLLVTTKNNLDDIVLATAPHNDHTPITANKSMISESILTHSITETSVRGIYTIQGKYISSGSRIIIRNSVYLMVPTTTENHGKVRRVVTIKN